MPSAVVMKLPTIELPKRANRGSVSAAADGQGAAGGGAVLSEAQCDEAPEMREPKSSAA
jgi:hypothetical protein